MRRLLMWLDWNKPPPFTGYKHPKVQLIALADVARQPFFPTAMIPFCNLLC